MQDLYEECQATFDPNHVAALLHSHPYHLDALLTMHDLYRSMGEQAYGGERQRRPRVGARVLRLPPMPGLYRIAGGGGWGRGVVYASAAAAAGRRPCSEQGSG